LFPYEGSGAVDDLIDLSALIGDSLTGELVADVSARADPALIAQALDIWLMRRLERVSRPRELPMLVAACDLLASGTRVQQVANALDVSRRPPTRPQLAFVFVLVGTFTPEYVLRCVNVRCSGLHSHGDCELPDCAR
jgi:hypothetical protein